MARRSLRPHLNQIRSWVRQGRTDAWIAHQLEVTVQQIEQFKRDNELLPEGAGNGAATEFDDEIDLRAEDDALIAAELEAEQARRAEEEALRAEEEARRAAERAARGDAGGDDEEDETDADGEERPRRRRGRRGGRGRARTGSDALEATFDHGEEGYGMWLDPAVADSPVYAEHWAGHRPVTVTVEPDRIVIRRAGETAADED